MDGDSNVEMEINMWMETVMCMEVVMWKWINMVHIYSLDEDSDVDGNGK